MSYLTLTDHKYRVAHADAESLPIPTDSVDLVFCSPPYEDARTYGIDFTAAGQEWVDWCVPRFLECLRVCRGLVAWVVQGRTRRFQWSATPALLIADLHRAGVCLRNPPIFHRVGIPGSGGPDWLRSDYEWIICATKTRGRLPWSDNVSTGQPPKYERGGRLSHRLTEDRVDRPYPQPAKANPGNVVRCAVGGGLMGSDLAHENEAPFPEALVEPFVRCFCPKGGIVLDPFCGSGTTLATALKWERRAVGFDVRQSQVELTERRIREVLSAGE